MRSSFLSTAMALAFGWCGCTAAHAQNAGEWSSFVPPPAAPDRSGPLASETFALVKQAGPWTDLEGSQWGKSEIQLLGLLRQGKWTAAMDWLKQANPDVNAQDPVTGVTALSLASSAGQLELTRELMKRGAELDRIGGAGWTPLGGAVFHGHELVVRDLLRRGARVDAPGSTGQLPLHLACATGQTRMIGLLLDNGADWRAYNRQGRHAMSEAALFGQIGAMRYLAERGASYAEWDQYRLNAVHAAALGQQKEALDFLEKQQVPVPSVLSQVLIDQVRQPIAMP